MWKQPAVVRALADFERRKSNTPSRYDTVSGAALAQCPFRRGLRA